jgi:Transposase IS116/IS110/IS902 family
MAEEVEKLPDDFFLSEVLMSMPGVGIKTAATILLSIGDAGSFRTAGHLAAYVGITHPTPCVPGPPSGNSQPAPGTNNSRTHSSVLHGSPPATTPPPTPTTPANGPKGRSTPPPSSAWHGRRYDVIYAMLRNGTLYEEKAPQTA